MACAAFTYDDNGKRVKSTINSVSTIFVGNYYEKTGSTIAKYYYGPTPSEYVEDAPPFRPPIVAERLAQQDPG